MNNKDFIEQLNRYYAVWQEYSYVYEEWANDRGLSYNSLLTLSALYEGRGDCTQKKISQMWMIPKQTVNMILKDFERNGIVELSAMQNDKRSKLIRLTDAGYKYADNILSELRKAELSVIEEIGIERMKQLNDGNALFVKLFKKSGGEK